MTSCSFLSNGRPQLGESRERLEVIPRQTQWDGTVDLPAVTAGPRIGGDVVFCIFMRVF
jgi:hypothetical protein